jgi:hypothetical protein
LVFSIKFNKIDDLTQAFQSKIQHQKSNIKNPTSKINNHKKRPTISCQPSQSFEL